MKNGAFGVTGWYPDLHFHVYFVYLCRTSQPGLHRNKDFFSYCHLDTKKTKAFVP